MPRNTHSDMEDDPSRDVRSQTLQHACVSQISQLRDAHEPTVRSHHPGARYAPRSSKTGTGSGKPLSGRAPTSAKRNSSAPTRSGTASATNT